MSPPLRPRGRSGTAREHWHPPRLLVAVLALVAVLGATLAIQTHQDRTRTTAQDDVLHGPALTAAQDREIDRAERSVQERAAAEADRGAQVRLAVVVDASTVHLAAAQVVLDSSTGLVDDTVRARLATAIGALTALLQSPTTATHIAAAADEVQAASAAVRVAHEAALVAAAPPSTRGTSPAAGSPVAAAPEPAIPADGRPRAADGTILWVTSVPTVDGDGTNGRMPMQAMCSIPWGTDQLGYTQYLRCDAAAALTELDTAFRAQFGESLAMDLTYRSFEDQVAMKAVFGALAARPGTSAHGTGTALDVQEWPDVYGFGTPRYAWLVAEGPRFGWFAPARVRADGSYPEFWHFEYEPGRTS